MDQMRCPKCGGHNVTRVESGCSFLEFMLVAGFLVGAVLTALFVFKVLSAQWGDALVIGLTCALGTGLVIIPTLWRSRRKTPERYSCMACRCDWERHPEDEVAVSG